MLNNIVVDICQELSQRSIAAFRFNFRGVGGSEGEFGGGIAERADVEAALAFILSMPGVDTGRIGLAGYSFGASVVLPVAVQDERVGPLALVSPALSDSGWGQFKAYHRAKFVIVGDADSVIPPERFQQHIRDIVVPGQYQVVAGADHFWWGHEKEVAEQVTQFFAAGFTRV